MQKKPSVEQRDEVQLGNGYLIFIPERASQAPLNTVVLVSNSLSSILLLSVLLCHESNANCDRTCFGRAIQSLLGQILSSYTTVHLHWHWQIHIAHSQSKGTGPLNTALNPDVTSVCPLKFCDFAASFSVCSSNSLLCSVFFSSPPCSHLLSPFVCSHDFPF